MPSHRALGLYVRLKVYAEFETKQLYVQVVIITFNVVISRVLLLLFRRCLFCLFVCFAEDSTELL